MAARIGAQHLGIDLNHDTERSLFKWFIASFLMGKRIRTSVAVQAYRVLVEERGVDTPAKLAQCSHRELVKMLGEAGYARYDESTAERLHALAETLMDSYGGSLVGLLDASASREDAKHRLRAFKGVGPKTLEIFLRDAGPWLASA